MVFCSLRSGALKTGSPICLPVHLLPPQLATTSSDKVFLVLGRDDVARNEVALFLRNIGLDPIIFHLNSWHTART